MYKISRKYFSLLLFFGGFVLQIFLIILIGNIEGVSLQPSGIRLYLSNTLMVIISTAILIFVYGLYMGFSEMFKQKKIFFSCLVGIFLNLMWLSFLIIGLILSFLGYA